MTGPLTGYRILELGGAGPGAFAGQLLADLGAQVIRIDRVGGGAHEYIPAHQDVMGRGKRSIEIDTKNPVGTALVLELVASSHALIEGNRPGVLERMGFAPEVCHQHNPALVIGRLTGWGQTGPRAQQAGHEINYIGLSGVLGRLGTPDAPPTTPLGIVGDFAGGGMLLAFGILAALLEAKDSGQGQVIDAAMAEGSALLASALWGLRAAGIYDDTRRGTNLADGGAPFSAVYECADGRHLAVAPIEPKFHAEFLTLLGLSDDPDFAQTGDTALWPGRKEALGKVFTGRTRDEWVAVFEGSSACVTPVLDMGEALEDPHLRERGSFVEVAGVAQPAPAPRFDRTPAGEVSPPPRSGANTREVLSDLGYDNGRIDALLADRTVGEA